MASAPHQPLGIGNPLPRYALPVAASLPAVQLVHLLEVGLDVRVGAFEERLVVPVEEDPAIGKHHDPRLEPPKQFGVVGDHHARPHDARALPCELRLRIVGREDELVDLPAHLRIEAGGRLVQEHDAGPGAEGDR